MRAIYEKFEDAEYTTLLEAKAKAKLNWHDFIMQLAKKKV